jgi:uncharacterized membrane protein
MQQFTRRRDMALAVGVGEQSIVADAMKAGGQYVQEEALHELVGAQRHRFVARPAVSPVVGEQQMKGVGAYDGAVRAVAWYSPTRVVQLGFFHGGNHSKATAINSDGTVIVGVANSSTVFRWTQSTGMEALTDWIKQAGGDSPPLFVHRRIRTSILLQTANDRVE